MEFGGEEQYRSYESPFSGMLATFNRRCRGCGRWTKPHPIVMFMETIRGEETSGCMGTCKKCGKVELEFEGWFSKEDCS